MTNCNVKAILKGMTSTSDASTGTKPDVACDIDFFPSTKTFFASFSLGM